MPLVAIAANERAWISRRVRAPWVFFPLVLAFAFRAAGFQGFQAAEGFDQQRLALRGQLQAFFYGIAQARLDDKGEEGGDRERQQGDND